MAICNRISKSLSVIIATLILSSPCRADEPKAGKPDQQTKSAETKGEHFFVLDKLGEIGAHVFYVSGVSAMQAGKYHQALDEFNKAIELAPNNRLFLQRRGECFLYLEEYSKCVEDLTRATKLGSNPVPCLLQRAQAYFHLNEYSKCSADLDEVLRKDPDNDEAQIWKATCYLISEQADKALASAQRAVELNPLWEARYANYVKAAAYELKKDNKNALIEYDKAIENHPKDVTFLLRRADILVTLNKKEEALRDYDRAIALDANCQRAFFEKGCLFYDQNKNQQALENFNRAIQLNPRKRSYFLYRGCTYENLKRYPEAIHDYSEAIAIDTNDADSYKRRAGAFSANNQIPEAIKDYATALKLAPRDRETEVALAELKARAAAGKSAPSRASANPENPASDLVKYPDLQQEPAVSAPSKPAVAHTVETFSGSSCSIKAFDKEGHPIESP